MKLVAVMLLVLAVAMVQGEAVTRPTIPDAWNATIKGNLINFFPFTGPLNLVFLYPIIHSI
jgi:hypothetical protein